MRFVMPRHGRLLASIATAGILLAGCGTGQPGAAAIVGDTRIPVGQVQSWFTEVLDKEPGLRPQLQQQGTTDELGRRLASFTVQQELIRQAAIEEGLRVDEQRVTAAIDQMGGPRAATQGTIFTEGNIRDMTRSRLLAAELARKYVDRLSVTIDYTQASTRAEAEAKAHRLARSPQEAAALLQADRQAGLRAVSGERVWAADQGGQMAGATPLFGMRPGSVVAFELEPQSGQWLVAVVRQRDTATPAPTPVAAQLDEASLQKIGTNLVGITADRVGVQLSPRYGVWDRVALGAAPNAGETTGFWLPGGQPAAT
ncbi:SurA N-terminal domain-containing protein [Saccharopolyspora erythraea]|uniref:SurA N-terminal domain-containing protein n=1 Tax=Saccharopolyspora erythraea TaxID=1836 RepID=UPI002013AAD2|nr:SurA N-terminal domain-containing protein [Saccharopolyspora erythraea]